MHGDESFDSAELMQAVAGYLPVLAQTASQQCSVLGAQHPVVSGWPSKIVLASDGQLTADADANLPADVEAPGLSVQLSFVFDVLMQVDAGCLRVLEQIVARQEFVPVG